MHLYRMKWCFTLLYFTLILCEQTEKSGYYELAFQVSGDKVWSYEDCEQQIVNKTIDAMIIEKKENKFVNCSCSFSSMRPGSTIAFKDSNNFPLYYGSKKEKITITIFYIHAQLTGVVAKHGEKWVHYLPSSSFQVPYSIRSADPGVLLSMECKSAEFSTIPPTTTATTTTTTTTSTRTSTRTSTKTPTRTSTSKTVLKTTKSRSVQQPTMSGSAANTTPQKDVTYTKDSTKGTSESPVNLIIIIGAIVGGIIFIIIIIIIVICTVCCCKRRKRHKHEGNQSVAYTAVPHENHGNGSAAHYETAVPATNLLPVVGKPPKDTKHPKQQQHDGDETQPVYLNVSQNDQSEKPAVINEGGSTYADIDPTSLVVKNPNSKEKKKAKKSEEGEDKLTYADLSFHQNAQTDTQPGGGDGNRQQEVVAAGNNEEDDISKLYAKPQKRK